MRLLAVADPDARGIITENGNVVGDITFGGTMGLVAFIGIPSGILGGLIVYLVRRWLRSASSGAGSRSVVLLALLGRTVIDPGNFDFFFLDPAGLAVALFGALFFVAGSRSRRSPTAGGRAPRLFYRQDVTLVGGIALAVAVVLGVLELGRDIAELV